MFPNLRAEMARNKLTVKGLSELSGIKPDTLTNKISGETEFKLREMLAIQSVFKGCSLEYLFESEE